jgi:hypothetical protein
MDESYDQRVLKKHFPKDLQSSEILSFEFESDPNLFLLKNKIAIHMTIALNEDFLPSNGFAAKQFGVMEVELNSQLISSSKTT